MNSQAEFHSFKSFVDNLNSSSIVLVEEAKGEFELSYEEASVGELRKVNSFLDDLGKFN